ncbi:MAG: TolB family protein [Gemmatimonadales bacterium]
MVRTVPLTACCTPRAIAAALAVALPCLGCSFSPLNHRIDVGREPFLVFAGEGIDQHTDLFAVKAGGGDVVQVTFTPLIEQAPRLNPTGDVVAFLRMRDTLPASHRDVVLMNLLSGGEAELRIPAGDGQPRGVAWNTNGTSLYIRTDRGIWRSPAPPDAPVAPVAPSDLATADSALDLWLGKPPFARVVDCVAGGLCIIGPKRDTTALAPSGVDAMRWGDDSVAWFENGNVMVRSLGPGRLRRVLWRNPPMHPRDGSYAGGTSAPAP